MQVQLVNLEDGKLMKLYCLDAGINHKIFFSESDHMFASFDPVEDLDFHLFEKKNFPLLTLHLDRNEIKYELNDGKLNDALDPDNWINIIERPHNFYLLQSKSGCKLITFKTRHFFDKIRILHLTKEICEIEFTNNETAERIVKKNTRKYKTIDRQTSRFKRVQFNKKKVEKIKEDFEKAKIEFFEINEI